MISRPNNHVTRQMDAIRQNQLSSPDSGEFPPISPRLLERLEKDYPARCKEPGESLEEHMEYAGMVKLVGILRTHFDRQADFGKRQLEDELLGDEEA